MASATGPTPARQLRRNLLRIGRRTTSVRGVNGFGAGLALVAFLAVALGVAGAVVATVVYEHRDGIARSRSPAYADLRGGTPTLAWDTDRTFVGEREVAVVALQPVASNPPLPPGLSTLPGPGEAVLSPALHDLLADEGAPERFGREVGTIGPDGLASATELIAYVGSDQLVGREVRAISGFGVPDGAFFLPVGEEIYDRDVQEFWSLAGFLCVLPGLLALGAAARVADDDTRRRHRLLVRLGADSSARRLVAAPRALAVGGFSLAVCLAALAAVAVGDMTVPFTGWVLEARIVRPHVWWIGAVVVVVHLLCAVALATLTAAGLGRADRLEASRLTVPADRPAWRRTACLIAVLAVQPWIVAAAPTPVVALSTLAAAAVAVVCLPPALATLLQALARRRAPAELSRGRVGEFLGWRVTAHRSRAIARLIGTVTSLVVIVCHAAVVLTLFAGSELGQYRSADRIGTTALHLRWDGAEWAEVERFAAGHDLAPAGVRFNPLRDETTVVGDCDDVGLLGLPCREGPVDLAAAGPLAAEVISWLGSTASVAVRLGSPAETVDDPDVLSSTVLLSRSGEDVDDLALAADAYAEFAGAVSIERLGALTLGGALDLRHKAQWVYVFGVPGVVTLLIVGALTWAAVVVEESRALVRSPLLAGRDDVFDAMAKIRLALPIAAGGVSGAVASIWLLLPHVRTGAAEVPLGFLGAAVVLAILAGAMAWWSGRRVLAGAARRTWRA